MVWRLQVKKYNPEYNLQNWCGKIPADFAYFSSLAAKSTFRYTVGRGLKKFGDTPKVIEFP